MKKKTSGKNKIKYSFQGQSVISQHWFKLDIYCIVEKSKTRKPDFIQADMPR